MTRIIVDLHHVVIDAVKKYILSQGSSIEAKNVSIYLLKMVLERFNYYGNLNIKQSALGSGLPKHVIYFIRNGCQLRIFPYKILNHTVCDSACMVCNLSILFDRKDLWEASERVSKTYKNYKNYKFREKQELWTLACNIAAIECIIDGSHPTDDELCLISKKMKYNLCDSNGVFKERTYDINSILDRMAGANLKDSGIEIVMRNIFLTLIEKYKDIAFPEHIIQFNDCKVPTHYEQSDKRKFGMINFSELTPEAKLSVIRMMPPHDKCNRTIKNICLLSNGGVQRVKCFLIPNNSIQSLPKKICFSEKCIGCQDKDGSRVCYNCMYRLCRIEKQKEITDLSNDKYKCDHDDVCNIVSKLWPYCSKCVLNNQFDGNWWNIYNTYERLCNNSDFDIVGNLEKIRSFIERDGKDFHTSPLIKPARS
jgi:hypothetical protein